MSRAKLFIDNILVYGLGGMLAKLVPFLMLPIVTRLMPNTDYFALSDLTTTIVSFAQSFAIMGMYDAMFRMFFEKEDESYKKEICSTALFFVTGSSLIVAICLIVLRDPVSQIIFGSVEFSSLVVVSAVSTLIGGNNAIVQAPTRMQNKRVVFIVMNLVTAVLSYAISIPLLLLGEYLFALPVAAALASASSLVVFLVLNHKWFSLKSFNTEHLKVLLRIGLPVMPAFLFYWVFNSFDRIMIVNMLGTGPAGIYAIASKMGQMSQLVYTAFAQGWQYFAFSTMNDDDQLQLHSKVFEYLALASFVAGALYTAIYPIVYKLLFEDVYYSGSISSVYLFMSPLLLMLYQTGSNQFLVAKRTWPGLIALALGAATNVVLNWLLIPLFGIEGASLSTFCGYVVTVAVCVLVLVRMRLFLVPKRMTLITGVFVGFLVLWRLFLVENLLLTAFASTFVLAAYSFVYRKEVVALISSARMNLRPKREGGKK